MRMLAMPLLARVSARGWKCPSPSRLPVKPWHMTTRGISVSGVMLSGTVMVAGISVPRSEGTAAVVVTGAAGAGVAELEEEGWDSEISSTPTRCPAATRHSTMAAMPKDAYRYGITKYEDRVSGLRRGGRGT